MGVRVGQAAPLRAPLLALLAAVAILAGGCSASFCAGSGCGGGSIDTAKAERAAKSVVAEAGGGVPVKSVICPKSVKLKQGATFTCTATGDDGTTAPVILTQTDGSGNLHITPPALLHTVDGAKLISSGLTTKLKLAVAVKCPDLVLAHKGTALTCKATHSGQTRDVKVTVTDDQGDIHYVLG